MKRLLLTLVTLLPSLLLAQNPGATSLPSAAEIRNAAPQQLADILSEAVRKNPTQSSAIVRRALTPFQSQQQELSEEDTKRVSAIVSSVLAASPPSSKDMIVAAGVGTLPALGASISSAANSVATQVAESGSSSGMLLGNIRVLEIAGKDVEIIDATGKISKLKQGEFLRQGVRIVTGTESSATLIFENGSSIRVEPGSEFSIEKFTQDPFNPEGLDYRQMKSEPSRSVTRTGLTKGEISFNVSDLKKNSSYEIVTPVGVCGIRGTGGFVSALPKSQQAAFGLYDGSAVFTTPTGQTQTVNQNQSIAVGGPSSNFAVNPNPPGAQANLQKAQQSMQKSSSVTPTQPFLGAPPPQNAPPDPMSSLTPAQQQALQQAAVEGPQAIAEIAQQLAAASPAAAADIAAAAADVSPAAAAPIASRISSLLPGQAASIAAAVAAVSPLQAAAVASVVSAALPAQAATVASAVATVVPAQAATVASFVTIVAPAQATAIAVSISTSVPSEAGAVAASVTTVVPAQAAAIASSVATAVPAQAASVASSVATVVPAQAATVAAAVATAVPTQATAVAVAVTLAVPAEASSVASAVSTAVPLQAAAVNSAVASAIANSTQGDAVGTVNTPSGPSVDQNPAALTTPTPTPTPTPVSPSF